jgi:hypothetical protein
VTFAVDNVEVGAELPVQDPKECLQAALGGEPGGAGSGLIEAWSHHLGNFVGVWGGDHGFIAALNAAYHGHLPLILSPDMIWLLVAQGFARHVNENAEALRGRFVSHPGKAVLTIRRDEFLAGFEGNDWEGVVSELCLKIKARTDEHAYRTVVRSFSTTGIVERAAMEITLLDAMQPYFDYCLYTLCGYPSITLEGTAADWQGVLEGARQLRRYELDWWLDALEPVLEEFACAANGHPCPAWWQSLFKQKNSSGGPYITGHITRFFPYVRDHEGKYARNSTLYLSPEERSKLWSGGGLTIGEFGPGRASAPFNWTYYGADLPMELTAGFFGAEQDAATRALRPVIGWAVLNRRSEA